MCVLKRSALADKKCFLMKIDFFSLQCKVVYNGNLRNKFTTTVKV